MSSVGGNVKQFQEIENRTTAWYCNSTLEYLSNGSEITISKRYPYFCVYCSIIFQDMETTYMFTDGWLTQKICIYYSYIYYSAIKKEGNLANCYNMDGSWGHYIKWNKSDRKRQILYDLTYKWNLKKP